MVDWHGFFPENTRIVLKAVDYTKTVVIKHFENLKSEVEKVHHEELEDEKNEIIEKLNDLKTFLEETTGRHKRVSSDFIRRIQNEIKSILAIYLMNINHTLTKIDSPALLKEKMFVEEIINREDYNKYEGKLFLKYIDIKNESEKFIFISYSTKDKLLAGEINEILQNKYKFKSFLAHETIDVSKFWRDEILKNLMLCTGIIALVTDNFVDSCWTHQEIGYGIGKNIPIFSLFYTTNKLGFLEAIQGINMENNSIEEALDYAYQYM